jgi:hypothetical protein
MARRFAAAVGAMLSAAAIATAAAQTGNLKDTQLNPDRIAAPGRRAIVIGCVSRDGAAQASRYLLTDTRAQPPVQYRLEGDADLLRFHVGHLVEIAGLFASATGGGKANAGTLKVEALTYLATRCIKLQ